MFNHVEKNIPLVWTFSDKYNFIRELFRAWMIGGLTIVFHKHFDLTGGTDSPLAARIVPNGNALTHCIFLDFNR